MIEDAIARMLGEDRPIRMHRRPEIAVDESRREVYSYGRHFPLFHFAPRALNGARDLFLINGDIWRGSGGWGGRSRTWDHQARVREYVRASGKASVVIPFSALTGAGIDLDSVRVIDVRPDAEWTETVTVRTREELPRHERTVWFTREHAAPRLEDLPASEPREVWREATADELAAGAVTGGAGTYGYLPRLAGADGLFRWTSRHERPREADADGLFRYERRMHRLGDCLISAVRASTFTRAARPFEVARESARETVELIAREGNGRVRSYCSSDAASVCESGPAGACVHCGAPLEARVTVRRRARYLSSFDMNEPAPLYFLAQVPRGAGNTVAAAIDSLAPRAVHAAIARGREVRRQGDIFFIDTELTREDLAARGATFARLTQWTRDARARRGEVNYRAPQTARERRREARHARALWRERFADIQARAGTIPDRREAREANRARWFELEARHARERREAWTMGAPLDSPLSTVCDSCGAAVGADCSRIDSASESLNARIEFERLAAGGFHRPRVSLEARQRTEVSNLRHEMSGREAPALRGAPQSPRGARRRARRAHLKARADVDVKRAVLRKILARPYRHISRREVYRYGAGAVGQSRENHARAVITARRELEYAERRLRDTIGARARARDDYRSFGPVAEILWREARQKAAERFRPEWVDSRAIGARRERARRMLAVYGTAHSATEVARVAGGAVYVRGTVRHVPELEPGRGGAPDHRPLTLTAGRWYLAVRNTVPRQDTRGARRG